MFSNILRISFKLCSFLIIRNRYNPSKKANVAKVISEPVRAWEIEIHDSVLGGDDPAAKRPDFFLVFSLFFNAKMLCNQQIALLLDT